MIKVTFTGKSIRGSEKDIKTLTEKLQEYYRLIEGTHYVWEPTMNGKKEFVVEPWSNLIFAVMSLDGVSVDYEVPHDSKQHTIPDFQGSYVFDEDEKEELAKVEHDYMSRFEALKKEIAVLNDNAKEAKKTAEGVRTEINVGYKRREFADVTIIYDANIKRKVYLCDGQIIGFNEMTDTDMRNFKQNGESVQMKIA